MSELHFVQVETEFIDGPEPGAAAAELGVNEDQLLGMVVRAWCWSLRHAAPRGHVLGPGAVQTIERAAGWKGSRGAFIDALPTVFQPLKEGVRFMGWAARYGKKIKARQDDAERKRRERELKRLSKLSNGQSNGREHGQVGDSPKDSFSPSSSSVVSSSLVLSSSPGPGERAFVGAAAGVVGALRDGMDSEFRQQRGRPYRWTHTDEFELRKLSEGEEEILRRWAIALRRKGYPTCTCVADLVRHWNAYATEEAAPGKTTRKPDHSSTERIDL